MPTPPLPNTAIAEFYRFALLLTGSVRTAEQVMADTLAEVSTHLGQVRNEKGRQAWFVRHIRERCVKNNESAPRPAPAGSGAGERPRALKLEAFFLAQRFHALPEPERSALALFYLDIFSVAEIAELLKMSLETLAETLGAARGLLAQALDSAAE